MASLASKCGSRPQYFISAFFGSMSNSHLDIIPAARTAAWRPTISASRGTILAGVALALVIATLCFAAHAAEPGTLQSVLILYSNQRPLPANVVVDDTLRQALPEEPGCSARGPGCRQVPPSVLARNHWRPGRSPRQRFFRSTLPVDHGGVAHDAVVRAGGSLFVEPAGSNLTPAIGSRMTC